MNKNLILKFSNNFYKYKLKKKIYILTYIERNKKY